MSGIVGEVFDDVGYFRKIRSILGELKIEDDVGFVDEMKKKQEFKREFGEILHRYAEQVKGDGKIYKKKFYFIGNYKIILCKTNFNKKKKTSIIIEDKL